MYSDRGPHRAASRGCESGEKWPGLCLEQLEAVARTARRERPRTVSPASTEWRTVGAPMPSLGRRREDGPGLRDDNGADVQREAPPEVMPHAPKALSSTRSA